MTICETTEFNTVEMYHNGNLIAIMEEGAMYIVRKDIIVPMPLDGELSDDEIADWIHAQLPELERRK